VTLFNQNWIGRDGEPVTGLAPAQVRLYAPPGVEPTPQQRGEVAHAYKLFCDVVKNSSFPSGFHVQNRKFTDGTIVRMTSNLGRHEVFVVIRGGGGKKIYRGFVIKPLVVDGAALVWKGFTTLLRDAAGVWRRWVSGYKPGGSYTTPPTFFVDVVRKQKPTIQSDAKYNDVYAFHLGKLYKNGEKIGGFSGAFGRPIIVAPQVFALTDGGTIYRNVSGTAALLFSWNPNVLVPGTTYYAGSRYAERATEPQVQMLLFNISSVGVLQTFRQTIKLLTAVPWFSTTGEVFAQYDAPTPLRSTSGWTSTADVLPTSPMFPVVHDSAYSIFWVYPYSITPGPVGTIYSATPVPDAPQTVRTYVKAITGTDVPIRLYPDIEGRPARGVSINASKAEGFVQWQNTNSSPPIWNNSINPTQFELNSGYWARIIPAPGFNNAVLTGDTINIGLQETGGLLTESDTAYSRTTLDTIGLIYSSDTVHSVVHRETTSTEMRPEDPIINNGGPFGYNQTPPPGGGDTGWVPVRYVFLTNPWPDVRRVRRTEELAVSGSAKDYVFADTENGVYVYFESVLVGTRTQAYYLEGAVETSSDTGGITFTVELVLESTSFGTFRGTKQTFALSDPATAPFITATDIAAEGTFFWQYVSPERVFPIFAPRGFGQGSCAEIAYTTAGEVPTKRLLASFREQVLLGARPSGFVVPTIYGVHQTNIPMGESLLATHFPGLYFTAIMSIEAAPFVLNASYPGANVHSDIGITGAAPHSKVYRT
jgi:hypothetical protein